MRPTSSSTRGVHIEAAPSKHAIAQGFFLYGLEPGGNRIEVTTGGYAYDPQQPAVAWSSRAKLGQAWGVKTVPDLPHVRHPAGGVVNDDEERDGPATQTRRSGPTTSAACCGPRAC